MAFTSQFTTNYRWRQNSGAGLEQVFINSCDNNVIISSVLIADHESGPIACRYNIICSDDWKVRTFSIENIEGHSLSMNSDGEGNWFDGNGVERPEFSGAIDVDFSHTPFTNTLPIRRMDKHQRNYHQRFKMLYVPFETLEPKIDRQQYACVTPYKLYRYEPLGRKYSAELQVDENAVVLDYPDIFTRQPS